jgi:hypothetical protein
MNDQTIDLVIRVKLNKVLDGPELGPNQVGAALVEQIADKVGDLAVVTPEAVSFYYISSVDFDRETDWIKFAKDWLAATDAAADRLAELDERLGVKGEAKPDEEVDDVQHD